MQKTIIYRVAELWLRERMSPSDIADLINRTIPGASLSRESVYPMLREALELGFIRLQPPVHETLAGELEKKFGLAPGSVRVVECPTGRSNVGVSAAAAEWAGELVKEIARNTKSPEVTVGLGPGSATLDFARRFSEVIAEDANAPHLNLVAITAGSPATEPQYASVTYFNLFPPAKVKKYIGFFAETFMPKRDFEKLKEEQRLGIKAAFEAKSTVQFVATSMGNKDDEHSLFRVFHEESGRLAGPVGKRPRWWKDCVGDCQYRPYSAVAPIEEGPDDLRAVTMFELDELARMAETKDKHVMLIVRPCRRCGMTRAKALLPLLTSPKLRVFSKLVVDSATATDLLTSAPAAP